MHGGTASGINDAGDIAGGIAECGSCEPRALLWRGDAVIDRNDVVDQTVRDDGWVLTWASC